MCKNCLHFDHCISIPNYPVSNNTIACNDWLNKDKYVSVVRCRDCKHCMLWNNATEKGIGDCRIRIMNSDCVDFVAVRDNDFCSYGERRCEDD